MLCCQNERGTGYVVNGYDDGELLFDASLITDIDWSTHKAMFRGDISPHKPGRNLFMRPLSVDDFDKGLYLTKLCFNIISCYASQMMRVT